MSTPQDNETPLTSAFAGDPDMMELVEFFVQQMPSRVQALRASIDSGSIDELRTLAHQLKGAGGSYGFPGITESARRLEEDASGADIEAIKKSVDELIDLCGRTTV